MSGETESDVSGWTTDTYRAYNEAMRREAEKFAAERDLRYREVANEREKALKIKETADLAALQLAREIQTYKDEKANQLREQISRERGLYVTQSEVKAMFEKMEATVVPLVTFVASQQGRSGGNDKVWSYIFAALGVVFGIVGVGVALYTVVHAS